MTRVVCFEEPRELRGRWSDSVYHLRFSVMPIGLLEGWMDGVQVIGYKGALGYPDGRDRVHFRFGLYRDHLSMPMTALYRHVRRVGSFEATDPTPSRLAPP